MSHPPADRPSGSETVTTDGPSRTPVPEGTIPVAVALLIAGIATYAFFVIGNDAVGGDEAFEPIVSLWFATFALAPGFFLPLEQELGRALAHRRAIGQGTRPIVVKVVRLAAVLVAGIVAVILLASPLITSGYFDGEWIMLFALIGAFVAYAPAHLARGICSGSGRFRHYALIMGSDGIVRIALCVVLAAIGITAVGPYAFAVAASPLVAVAWVWRRGGLVTDDGPPASWKEVAPNLGWLLVGSVFAAMLLNAGPITASLLADESEDAFVTRFSYGVLLARIPLFLFQAVQAALLPRLSRLAARGEFDEFRAGLTRLLLLVVGVAVVGTSGAFILGPWAIEFVYDAELGSATLAALALASGVYMMALALAQAVIALQGHVLVALGWGLAVASFVIVTWATGPELFRRIEYGLLASSITAVVVFGLALRQRLASGAEPDQGSVMEAITDLPLEG